MIEDFFLPFFAFFLKMMTSSIFIKNAKKGKKILQSTSSGQFLILYDYILNAAKNQLPWGWGNAPIWEWYFFRFSSGSFAVLVAFTQLRERK